ncbi:hypothetical protein [Micromonospora sp. RP3T]|uniref:hypothetical protein n=1 Tax=Micromonospora sp. RP3T TaxID=2135446 RepID=UPI003D73371E
MADTTPAGPPAATSDDDFDRLVAGANMPEIPVPLCLDGKLRRQYEEVKDRIASRAAERTAAAAIDASDVRLGTRSPADDEPDPEQAHADELVERMRAATVVFLVRAMSSTDYNRLLEAHPPRKDPTTGRVDMRDFHGYHAGTFPNALVRKSIAAPTMTDQRWAQLDAALTDAQFDKLFQAAANCNRRDEDLPF